MRLHLALISDRGSANALSYQHPRLSLIAINYLVSLTVVLVDLLRLTYGLTSANVLTLVWVLLPLDQPYVVYLVVTSDMLRLVVVGKSLHYYPS